MNRVVLMGRLTRDADIRTTSGQNPMAVARYTLAVDRRKAKDGEQQTDFISCVSFGKAGEFMERYGKKGTKFLVEGRIQTGSYTNRDGQKVYTTDIVTENIEFAESKAKGQQSPGKVDENGFMNIPDDIDEDIPFT